MTTKRILVVEDDENSLELLRRVLIAQNYQVHLARTGQEALNRAPLADLVLLDLQIPAPDGYEVAKRLRQRYADMPIIIVTAQTASYAQVRGLDAGADDYVTKPIDLAVLTARVRAKLRKHSSRERLEVGNITIDMIDRHVYVDYDKVMLTHTEFDVLVLLAKRPYQAFSRHDILTSVWHPDFDGTERVVDVCISSLRQKLGDKPRSPRYIESVHGIGYRFIGP
ncbi:MAG: response regulator transcription factor [Deinococcota bacterium]